MLPPVRYTELKAIDIFSIVTYKAARDYDATHSQVEDTHACPAPVISVVPATTAPAAIPHVTYFILLLHTPRPSITNTPSTLQALLLLPTPSDELARQIAAACTCPNKALPMAVSRSTV